MASILLRRTKGSVLDLDEQDDNLEKINNELITTTANLTTLQAGVSTLIYQSYVGITRSSDNATDTTRVILASNTIPAGLMNLNGEIIIMQDWKMNASATKKVLGVDWGYNNVIAPEVTDPNVQRTNYRISIKNLNDLATQSIFGHITFGGAWGNPTAAVDTSSSVVIDHTCKWGANVVGEQITLLGYGIWYIPGIE